MANTPGNSDDTEPIEGTDQTNGLAGNLEGDDDGAEDTEQRHGSLLGEAVKNGLNPEPDEDDTTDSGYSEEGRP